MAKTKTPFLSLGAQGSVGDALTSQKRGRHTLLRKKPTPTDPYSLPQAYQRWLYEDYAYLWRQQSTATRQAYAAAGSRHHLTGFQHWMSVMLTTLHDIVGYWKLDDNLAATTVDSSRNANTGTIVGASPATGFIDGCLYFDGINDYVNIVSPDFNFTSHDFSIDLFIQFTNLTTNRTVVNRGLANAEGYRLEMDTNVRAVFYTYQAAAVQLAITPNNSVPLGELFHFCVTRSGAVSKLYINGVDLTIPIVPHIDPAPSTRSLKLGIYETLARDHLGLLDHVLIYNRVLDPTEVARHAERRYPV